MRRSAPCATRRARPRSDPRAIPGGPSARRIRRPWRPHRERALFSAYVPPVSSAMRFKTAWMLARDTLASWSDDYAASMGAALAYYTMFSIAPLLLIVISVAGLAFGESAARSQITEQLQSLVGAEGARTVQALVASIKYPRHGLWTTSFGVGALIVGATTVF